MAYNSAYTGSEIDAAVGAVKQKETTWDDKQNALTGAQGQVVGFGSDGKPVAQDAPSGLPEGTEGQLVGYGADGNAQAVDSPYQKAVAAGYTGTEAEFYAALVTLKDGPFLPLSGGAVEGNVAVEVLSIADTFHENFQAVNLYNYQSTLVLAKDDNTDVVISGVATPENDFDAANKEYVDSMKPAAHLVTLIPTNWDTTSKTITVTVPGVGIDETAQEIRPMPSMASQAAYIEAGIRCTAQEVNCLTFTAETVPTDLLEVYVVITELSYYVS